MDPTIWGPHYWFIMHTVAFHYPVHPTAIQKKIHYRWIHHLPELIPNKSIGSMFSDLLQQYPISPYLDTRDDFILWTHHIHNVVNQKLNKPTMTLSDHYNEFNHYMESPSEKRNRLWKEQFQACLFMLILAAILYWLTSVATHMPSHGYNLQG
jgi:hypothetical protein